jgi:hypothetical protein
VLECSERGSRALEGKLFTKTVFVAAMCGVGAIVPTLAQDEARIFQYSPVAQLVGEGQYRAEVWRRENASGQEERAWSGSELHASKIEAIAAACATLRENFAFSCTETSRDAKAGGAVKASAAVVTKDASPPKEKAAKAAPVLPASAPKAIGAPKAISAPQAISAPKPISAPKAIAASKSGPQHWDDDFWSNQSRFGGGSGGGGGSQ